MKTLKAQPVIDCVNAAIVVMDSLVRVVPGVLGDRMISQTCHN